MKSYDILRFGFSSLTQRRLRSWLTVLGIVIGVASIVALISIGEGVQAQIESSLSGFGADVITITPGFQRASGAGGFGGGFGGGAGGGSAVGNLTEQDVQAVKSTQGVLYVDGTVSGRADISYLGESSTVSIQGVDTSVWRNMETTALASGRYLNTGETNAVVIGNSIANQLFKHPVTVDRDITIGGKTFKVVGILEAGGGFGQEDSVVYMSVGVARDILNLDSTKVTAISVKVADSSQAEAVASQITYKLGITRHAQGSKQDFTVTTFQSIQNQIASITGTITLFLGSIAGISLLVGAVGISNTMFTSVMERTRQIGILKSLGATDGEILKIFITEASLIGLIGGIIGVLAGMTASGSISALSSAAGAQGAFATVVTPDLIIYSLVFAVVIGAVSGLLPARMASRLEPVEALRYE